MERPIALFSQRAFATGLSIAAILFVGSVAKAEEPAIQEPLDLTVLEVLLDGEAEPLNDSEIADVRGQGGQGESKTLGLIIKEDPNRRVGASTQLDPTSMPRAPSPYTPKLTKMPGRPPFMR